MSELSTGCKARRKETAGGHLRLAPKPVPFQWPTRLAAGLGLKELPRRVLATSPHQIGSPVLLKGGDSAYVVMY